MHLPELLDVAELRREVAHGGIYERDHQTLPLKIYNYSPAVQFAGRWTPVTRRCRGLVVDDGGQVVARPYDKFHNVGERPETDPAVLARLGAPEVTHKLDGALIVMFRYQGETVLATRGSFHSPQAAAATAFWERHHAHLGLTLNPALTYLWEYLGPTSRVVVQYPDERLVLLGLVETATGRDYGHDWVATEALRLGVPVVPLENTSDWRTLTASPRDNFEGYVLYWPQAGVRAKCKYESYLQLHRLVTGLTEHRIWEALRDGEDLVQIAQVVPEELRVWLTDTIAGLTGQYTAALATIMNLLDELRAQGLRPNIREERKAAAKHILTNAGNLAPAVFCAFDGVDYANLVWRALEPVAVR